MRTEIQTLFDSLRSADFFPGFMRHQDVLATFLVSNQICTDEIIGEIEKKNPTGKNEAIGKIYLLIGGNPEAPARVADAMKQFNGSGSLEYTAEVYASWRKLLMRKLAERQKG